MNRVYSVYFVDDNTIVSHNEYPRVPDLSIIAKLLPREVKTIVNADGIEYELRGTNDTAFNYDQVVVPYNGAYFLVCYKNTIKEQAVEIVKNSDYCKKSVILYTFKKDGTHERRIFTAKNKLRDLFLINADTISFESGTVTFMFMNILGKKYSLTKHFSDSSARSDLDMFNESHDAPFESILVPYNGMYVLLSAAPGLKKEKMIDSALNDLNRQETIRLYHGVSSRFLAYPHVEFGKLWNVNSYLKHQLLPLGAHLNQWAFQWFERESLLNKNRFKKNMNRSEFFQALDDMSPFLEFQWEITDFMKELVYTASQQEAFWNQIDDARRVSTEYSFCEAGNSYLFSISMLRHATLPGNPVIMMVKAVKEQIDDSGVNQWSIFRPLTFYLWTIMHPGALQFKGLSIMMHSITSYSLSYVFSGLWSINHVGINMPYNTMRKILEEANRNNVISCYFTGGAVQIMITNSYLTYWTKWLNLQHIERSCIQCMLPTDFRCPCSLKIFYCGKMCQMEHWAETHHLFCSL